MHEYKQNTAGAAVGEASLKSMQPAENKSKEADDHISQKKIFGIANGKIKLPPDESFFDDKITEIFEDI